MINLIRNELFKIFHKKAFYIIILISIMLMILFNYMAIKKDSFKDGIFKLAINNNHVGKTKAEKEQIASSNASIELLLLSEKYSDKWQGEIVDFHHEQLEDYYYHFYLAKQNKEDLNKVDKTSLINFQNDLKKEYKVLFKELLEENKKSNKPLNVKKLYDYKIQYYLDNDLYLTKNKSLIKDLKNYFNTSLEVLNMSKEEKKKNKELIKDQKIYKYRLDKKITINDPYNFKQNILEYVSNMSIFIIALVSIYAGYSVSEEFSKGTIKLLLSRPYKRGKIFIAKLLSVFITMILFILITYILYTLAGIIFFGTVPLKEMVQIYDSNLNKVVEYSVFNLSFIYILASMPMFIFIMFLSFTIGSLSESGGFGVASGFMVNTIFSMLSAIVVLTKMKFLTLMPSFHWQLKEYLFGGYNSVNEILKTNYTMTSSIFIVTIYVVIIFIIGLVNFKLKDVKNI